jgi:hypothetical protein
MIGVDVRDSYNAECNAPVWVRDADLHHKSHTNRLPAN